MKRAVVFPGQGSQMVGMGRELAGAFPAAKLVFEEVDEALRENLSRIIFEGPDAELTLTENAQPAIMATSIAALRVLEKETGFRLPSYAAFVAGHSLGEYSALCAAGALSLSDTARLLKLRGRAMQKAVLAGAGSMAAILGLDFAQVEEVVRNAGSGGVCAVANDNCPGQVVISGAAAAVNEAIELAKAKGAKRAIALSVSAPFHCPLMEPAAIAMKEALAAVSMNAPEVPVVANVTAQPTSNPAQIRTLLVSQVTGMVRWRESVEFLGKQGITQTLELGAGRVLSSLIKRIAPEMETLSVSSPADLDQFAKVA